jgi:uncharacterized protein (TIGR02145 family)
MKQALFLFVIFCALETNAQNYYITFAGAGLSSTVSSVKVENLVTGTTLALNGNDILHLTATTGIDDIGNRQSSGLQIYPNPSRESSRLLFCPPVPGNAEIALFDISGKRVAQIQSYLENSEQEFQLSGLNSGLYMISIKGKTYHYSGKILSNTPSNGNNISIERINGHQVLSSMKKTDEDKGSLATIDMAYSAGNRLKFTGISGIYSTVLTDIPSSDKTITFNFIACTDGDNINYPVVTIGTQVWMAENLKTTKYRNGDLIGTIATVPSGETSPKYQWAYNDNEENVAVYGRLYTWYTVADPRNICPAGWHVATKDDYLTLGSNLGGGSSKLKETGTTHWNSPNTGATNESGFTALPGGWRYKTSGFTGLQRQGYWWTATEATTSDANNIVMRYDLTTLSFVNFDKSVGYSVRCMKD